MTKSTRWARGSTALRIELAVNSRTTKKSQRTSNEIRGFLSAGRPRKTALRKLELSDNRVTHFNGADFFLIITAGINVTGAVAFVDDRFNGVFDFIGSLVETE